MKRHRHSLSGLLLLLFLLTALLLAVVVRTGFHYGVDGNLRNLASPHLVAYLQYLLNELGDPPTAERAALLEERLPLKIQIFGTSDTSDDDAPSPPAGRRSISRTLPDGTVVEIGRTPDGFAVHARRDDLTVVLMPHGLAPADSAPLAIILTIAGVLAVLTLSYHAIRRLFKPIETIQAGVARIGAGDLEHRLDIRRRNELGELARSINAMTDDIQDMLEAKRQLLLAISHELRSPLTRARLNAELLEDNANRQALLADLSDLENLLAELLESERLRGRHSALKRQAVDPSVLLTTLVAESFPDAGIRLELDPPGTWLSLDSVRIRLLVRNLLKNAIRHTPGSGAPPSLGSHVDADQWTLTVGDRGHGIAAEHLSHLTDPFYRADPSRRRGSGGVGLGLYLSRAIAEAHDGTLDIESFPAQGTMVRVRIPVPEDTDQPV